MKKDNVIFLLMLISGLIIGSYLGSIAVIVPWLEWLNYGKTIDVYKRQYLYHSLLI